MTKIIDSQLSKTEAIGHAGPAEIRAQQEVLEVCYLGFDGKEHQGQIVMHHKLAQDVLDWFALAFELKFPIEKVAPATIYNGDDNQLIAQNISSGFNYRQIAGTKTLSFHAQGQAFDINPRQNPYIRKSGDQVIVAPPGAVWDPQALGTFTADHQLVKFMIDRGWEWGGNWDLEGHGSLDYQHFQKTLIES